MVHGPRMQMIPNHSDIAIDIEPKENFETKLMTT